VKAKWWNRRRTGTLIAAYVMAIIMLVGKCESAKSQCTHKRLEKDGVICFSKEWVFIRTKKDTFNLKLIRTDHLVTRSYYWFQTDSTRGAEIAYSWKAVLDYREKKKFIVKQYAYKR